MSKGTSKRKARSNLKRFARRPYQEPEDVALDPIDYFLFNESPDHAVAIVGPAILERALEDLISTTFRPLEPNEYDALFANENAPLGSLSAKTKLAFALNLITEEEKDEINCIRDIRNAFAHSVQLTTFGTKEITELCDHLAYKNPSLQIEKKEALSARAIEYRFFFYGFCSEMTFILKQKIKEEN